MNAIVVADVNARLEDLHAHDHAVVTALSEWVARQELDAQVEYATSFDRIEAIFHSAEPLALITNFPPDSTYDGTDDPQLAPGFGGMVYRQRADSYARTRAELARLCSVHPGLPVLVITGAPRHVLTDEDIVSASPDREVQVLRKAELFRAPGGYENAYVKAMVRHVARCIEARQGGRSEWREAQRVWEQEQLGAARVLVLCCRQDLGAAVCKGLNEVFDEIGSPLVLEVAASVELAHKMILEGQREAILSVLDADYWSPLHEGVAAQNAFVAFVRVAADLGGRLDVRGMALALQRELRAVRARIAQPEGLRALQREVISLLNSADVGALSRALRLLTGHHRTVLEALGRAHEGLNLFIPVATAADLEALVPKAAFLADRAVFTQLPVSESLPAEGETMELIPLWHFGGATCGSVIQAKIADVMRRYAPFFEDGRAVFYPSPTMISVHPGNVDEILPGRESVFAANPQLPVWQESRVFQQYISADKIAAGHAVVEGACRPIAEIGKAIAAIEIPYLAGTPPDVFQKVLDEHQDSLGTFRSRTSRVIDDLIDSGSDIESARIRKRFQREVEDGVKELESRLKTLRRSVVLQQAGATILTVVGTLVAVHSTEIPGVVAKLIGGGGLGPMAFQFAGYLQQLWATQKSPYHIVWKLKREGARRT